MIQTLLSHKFLNVGLILLVSIVCKCANEFYSNATTSYIIFGNELCMLALVEVAAIITIIITITITTNQIPSLFDYL